MEIPTSPPPQPRTPDPAHHFDNLVPGQINQQRNSYSPRTPIPEPTQVPDWQTDREPHRIKQLRHEEIEPQHARHEQARPSCLYIPSVLSDAHHWL